MNVRLSLAARLTGFALFLGIVTGCLVTGCSQQDENDEGAAGKDGATGGQMVGDADPAEPVNPHDVPITSEQEQQLRAETAKFSDAVAKVKELRDTVKKETLGGIPTDPFDAHQALDKADMVVQWLPRIARDSGVAKEHWETVTTAANELRELFDQVHLNIDNKVDPDFSSVEKKMADQLTGLEAITN